MAKIASSGLVSALLVLGVFSSFGFAFSSFPTTWDSLFLDPVDVPSCPSVDFINVSFAVTGDGYFCNRLEYVAAPFGACTASPLYKIFYDQNGNGDVSGGSVIKTDYAAIVSLNSTGDRVAHLTDLLDNNQCRDTASSFVHNDDLDEYQVSSEVVSYQITADNAIEVCTRLTDIGNTVKKEFFMSDRAQDSSKICQTSHGGPTDYPDFGGAIVPPIPIPGVDVNKTGNATNLEVGQTELFTILVNNTGNTDLQVTVTDNLPYNFQYLVGSATPTQPVVTGNTLVWSGINLNAGQIYTISFSATANGSGNWANNANTTTNRSVSDSSSFSGTTAVPNTAPVLLDPSDSSITETSLLVMALSASDVDGDTLTYSETGLPAFCSLNTGTGVVSCTPDYSSAGVYTVTFTVDDGNGGSDSEDWVLTVTNVNRDPVLTPVGAQSVDEAALLSFTMTGSDADGETLTFSATGLPSFCTFNDVATVDCNPGYSDAGTYSGVTLQVSDGIGGTDTEIITITVNNVNRPPVLDSIGDRTMDENSQLIFAISASDVDGDALTYAEVGLPAFCGMIDNGDGTATITCDATYEDSGSYSPITFTASDDILTDDETITLTVNNVNRDPVLDPIGAQSVDEAASLSFTTTGSDPDSDPITFSATGLPAFCTFNGVDTVDCNPGYSDAGAYSGITLQVSDWLGGTDAEVITITVNNVNRDPVLTPVGDEIVDENALLQFTLIGSDADGDSMTYSATGLPAFCSFSIDTISCTPTYDDAGNYPGVVLGVVDGNGGSATETISITVNNINRAPVLDAIGDKSVDEGDVISFSVTASDADGDALTFSQTGLPAFCSRTDAEDTDNQADFTCTPGFSDTGDYPVDFEASDNALSDAESITISVGNVNRAPVLDAIGDQTVDENALLQFALTGSDPDGDALVFSATGLPAFCSFSIDTISCTPTYDDAGNYPGVVLGVTDGTADDSETITITVNNVNRAPVLDAVGGQNVDEAGVLPLLLSATDADGDAITISQTGLPALCTFTDNGDGTADVSCSPTYDDAGSYTPITFTANDGALTDEETITLTVNNVNRDPILDTVGNRAVAEDDNLNFDLTGSDPDGDALSYSESGLQAFCSFTDNGDDTATVDCNPTFGDEGNYEVTFTVTDSGLDDSEIITISVGNTNRPPVLTPIGDKSVDEGNTIDFSLMATDEDGDSLEFSESGLPDFCTFTDNGDGTANVSCSPEFGDSSITSVLFSVTDGEDNAGEEITITVDNINRPPVIDPTDDPASGDENTTIIIDLTGSDPDGDPISFSCSNLPDFCALANNGDGTATITCTPDYTQAGTYGPLTCEVTDGTDTTALSDGPTITVNNVHSQLLLCNNGNYDPSEILCADIPDQPVDSFFDVFIYATDENGTIMEGYNGPLKSFGVQGSTPLYTISEINSEPVSAILPGTQQGTIDFIQNFEVPPFNFLNGVLHVNLAVNEADQGVTISAFASTGSSNSFNVGSSTPPAPSTDPGPAITGQCIGACSASTPQPTAASSVAATTQPTAAANLGPEEPKLQDQFMVYVPKMTVVGDTVDVKVQDKQTGLPLAGVQLDVYVNGVKQKSLGTTNSNGIAKFTPTSTGPFEFRGTLENWSQFNKALSTAVAQQQTSFQTPQPTPGAVTGLFVGVTPLNILALLLGGLAAYFLNRTGKAKGKAAARNHNIGALLALVLPFAVFFASSNLIAGVAVAVLEDVAAYAYWRKNVA